MNLDFVTLTMAGGLVAFVSALLLLFASVQFDRGGPALRLGLSHLAAAGAIILLALSAGQNPALPLFAQPVFVVAAFLALSSTLSFERKDRPVALIAAGDHARLSPEATAPEVRAPEVKSGEPVLAEAFDEFRRTFETFKEGNDRAIEELQRKGAADVVTHEKVERLSKALDEQKRAMDQALLRGRRPPLGEDGPRTAVDLEHKAAFDAYVRGGDEDGLRRVERKALAVSSDGGYTVPDETEREIGRRLAAVSPIRGISGIRQVSSNVYKKPFTTTGAVTGWVGETASRPQTTAPTLAELSFPAMAEWSYRRFVLHYAKLCKAAGGVDTFLIGSELPGLTTLRSDADTYPFVNRLRQLAEDVRQVLGPDTRLSYAADWTEYAGHRPADGSGDVYFHLDRLWAHDDIDFIGIDNYMPLADWRDGSDHLDAVAWESGRSAAYLRANIAGGEGFDWYYPSGSARNAQARTPITDGAYGKPWVHRVKDLKGWWSSLHYNRPGGVESATPTAWVPESKPFWFTEVGCPAVDKGANQPNVFPDPKSSASAVPYFSNGQRDDLIQRRYCEAVLSYWDPQSDEYVDGSNPSSSVYGGRMVRHARTHLWTWDARPFPAFPHLGDVWGDGDNWRTGHWLTGRFGSAPAADLVARILTDFGIGRTVVGELDGVLDGYVIDGVVSARQALEPLASLLQFEAVEAGDRIRFVRRGGKPAAHFDEHDLAEDDGSPVFALRRAQETELPVEVTVGFADSLADFRPSESGARRLVGGSDRVLRTGSGAVMGHGMARGLADAMLRDIWSGRETARFVLPRTAQALEPADTCEVTIRGAVQTLMVTRIEDGCGRLRATTRHDHCRRGRGTGAPDATGIRRPALPFGSCGALVGPWGQISRTDTSRRHLPPAQCRELGWPRRGHTA